MAACKECLHYDACVLNEAYWVKHNADQPCSEFKDKSRYVEQKHGRWVDRWSGEYLNPLYECSVCKKSARYTSKRDLLDNWTWRHDLTDYCPNCGAKMDGGKDSDI